MGVSLEISSLFERLKVILRVDCLKLIMKSFLSRLRGNYTVFLFDRLLYLDNESVVLFGLLLAHLTGGLDVIVIDL